MAAPDQLLLMDDEEFVRSAYAVILARPVDESGLRNYLGQVRRGISKEQIVVELATSPEGRARGGPAALLADMLAAQLPRGNCRICKVIRRLLSDALQPLLQQLRVIDNRIYRLERAASERDAELLRRLTHLNLTASPEGQAGPPSARDNSILHRTFSIGGVAIDEVFSTAQTQVRASLEAAVLRQRPKTIAVTAQDR